jgi:hypothetical protein
MTKYSILKETASDCVLQESFLTIYDAESELNSYRSVDPDGLYFIEEHEAEEPEAIESESEPARAAGPIFYGRYFGEPFESLRPGVKVAVYSLEAWERERARPGKDFKILVCETGEGFFYASSESVEGLVGRRRIS